VHRYHLDWSRNGTWERIAGRLAGLVRQADGRDADASAGIVDARSVRGAATVTSSTKGYDAGKKIKGRKTFGVVDTLGLLIAVIVVAASVSDNTGGIAVVDGAHPKSRRLRLSGATPGSRPPSDSTAARHGTAHRVPPVAPDRPIHTPAKPPRPSTSRCTAKPSDPTQELTSNDRHSPTI
jgi:hypothetical protein